MAIQSQPGHWCALLGYQPSLSWGSLLLPLLLLLQTTLYLVLVLQLMKRHFHASAQQDNRLQQLRSNWLLVLTLALILNWLVRNIAVLLTLFLGDQFSAVAQAIPRLALLLTLYLLAIYGSISSPAPPIFVDANPVLKPPLYPNSLSIRKSWIFSMRYCTKKKISNIAQAVTFTLI